MRRLVIAAAVLAASSAAFASTASRNVANDHHKASQYVRVAGNCDYSWEHDSAGHRCGRRSRSYKENGY